MDNNIKGVNVLKTKNNIESKNFNLFWIAQTISIFGSQITVVGLPLTAIYFLQANSFEMGIFQALATLPFFLFSLFVGVWIDRSKKKYILLFCNIMMAMVLLFIPLGGYFNFLDLTIFYIVVFFAGTFSMIFELAYLSYLPLMVSKNNISKSNSRLEISRTILDVSGPAIAGNIIAILTAPIAIIIDIFCYLISSIFLVKIKFKEPTITKEIKPPNIFKQIYEGIQVLFKSNILRSISLSTASLNFFRTAFDTIFILYLAKIVHISPTQIGLILGIGSIGGVAGALLATKISNKIGIGKSIIISTLIIWIGGMTVPFSSSVSFSFIIIIIGLMLLNFGNTMYFITQVSLRQSITPPQLLGRINASNRFLTRGAMPLGGIFGGFLGVITSLHTALIIITFGYISATFILYLSSVKNVRTISDVEEFKELNVS